LAIASLPQQREHGLTLVHAVGRQPQSRQAFWLTDGKTLALLGCSLKVLDYRNARQIPPAPPPPPLQLADPVVSIAILGVELQNFCFARSRIGEPVHPLVAFSNNFPRFLPLARCWFHCLFAQSDLRWAVSVRQNAQRVLHMGTSIGL